MLRGGVCSGWGNPEEPREQEECCSCEGSGLSTGSCFCGCVCSVSVALAVGVGHPVRARTPRGATVQPLLTLRTVESTFEQGGCLIGRTPRVSGITSQPPRLRRDGTRHPALEPPFHRRSAGAAPRFDTRASRSSSAG